ncbi:MAG: Gmad2 immunoglobulin-like domain-containing protein [Patescibacteria group bacterium]|nr:Gmad2 immunoglobulin-like domain-containing protein [Patescibacteria group bacterium]
MKSRWIILALLLAVIVAGAAALVLIPRPQTAVAPTGEGATTTPAASGSSLDDLIKVTTPAPNASVASPLMVEGQARGNWFFEATAPMALLDANGSVIAQGAITDSGDWTSGDFGAFTGSLTFPDQPAGSQGTLVLSNDNPSGNPATQKTLDIPVTF